MKQPLEAVRTQLQAHLNAQAKCFHPSKAFIEFKKDEIEQSIVDRFEQQVSLHANRIAVKFGNYTLSYDELNKTANRVAHTILARRKEAEEPIALFFEQGAQVIAAILGALKAGKIYVPLDPAHPPARLISMLEDSQATLVVTNNKNFSLAHQIIQDKNRLINIDTLDSRVSDENLRLSISPDTPAYILYTSGSTGQPKGVVHNHRNVLHDCMSYTNNFHFSLADRVGLLASVCVGASVHYLFGSLLNGAGLYALDLKEKGLTYLAAWLIQERITLFQLSANVFRHFLDSLTGSETFPDLRLIALGSAQVTRRDVELYKERFSSNCILVDRLSTTEARTIRWHFINKKTHIDGDLLPVGYAVEDKEVLLVDETGAEVEPIEIGEIAVRSRYLAPGYWRRPDLTRAKFLPDPDGSDKRIYLTGDLGRIAPDGCLEHLGRKDFRAKIRGFTVEVAEIERALLEHAHVRETAVVAVDDNRGDNRLVAYLTVNHPPAPSISELRRFLTEKLPVFMVPSEFVLCDTLPLTSSGKVDRNALPKPTWNRSQLEVPFVAPRTPVEEMVTAIWIEALGLERFGIKDNFFNLGGHSLLATKILSAVQDSFQVQLELRDLFNNPTIEELALTITENLARNAGQLE